MIFFRCLVTVGIVLSYAHAVFADDDDKLAKELIDIQEEFLSAIEPRPTGEQLLVSPLYTELVRRVSLANQNWVHQKQGADDAAKGKLSVVELPEQSDVDKAYLKILQQELGLEIKSIPGTLKGEAAVFYAYGYNSGQLEVLKNKVGERTLQDLIYRACKSLGYRSSSSFSLLFVPWRFSDSFKPTIQGLKEVPHTPEPRWDETPR